MAAPTTWLTSGATGSLVVFVLVVPSRVPVLAHRAHAVTESLLPGCVLWRGPNRNLAATTGGGAPLCSFSAFDRTLTVAGTYTVLGTAKSYTVEVVSDTTVPNTYR
jgi:hypothetical protein